MKRFRFGWWLTALVGLVGCAGTGSTSGSGASSAGGAAAGTTSAGASSGGAAGRGGTTSAAGAGGAVGAAGATSSGGASSIAGTTSTAGATSGGGLTGAGGATAVGGKGLHAVGNQIQDSGKPVRLIGWNRPGAEYSCLGNKPAVFDGPTDAASIQAMRAWKGFNTIRLPLNETCWLGINGASSAASGSSYSTAIADYVSLLRTNGVYVILDLHWNAPGALKASSQLPMADADHSLEFWKQVANQFKGDSGVILDLYNEPHLNSVPMGGFVAGPSSADAWSCWLNGGCTITPQTWEQPTGGYVVAGMQAMLDAVRATGATNLVLAGGLNWSGDLSGWAAHAPHDSGGNLAASAHIYYKPENCMGAACYSTVQDFAQATQVPIVTGEIGEFDCAHTFIDTFMAWADTSGVSYLAWSWSLEACGSPGPSYSAGPSLITDWNGTPTAYGQGFKDHLSTLSP